MMSEGVEESKFCVFLVVLPAKYVSSVSPRFHYRRHAFCFLPLAAILGKSLTGCVVGTINARSQRVKHLISLRIE
jgi:hypothetical protein